MPDQWVNPACLAAPQGGVHRRGLKRLIALHRQTNPRRVGQREGDLSRLPGLQIDRRCPVSDGEFRYRPPAAGERTFETEIANLLTHLLFPQVIDQVLSESDRDEQRKECSRPRTE